MSHPEFIPEVNAYLQGLRLPHPEFDNLPEHASHAIRSLGSEIESNALDGLPEEEQRRRMKLSVLARIDNFGPAIIPAFRALGVSISDTEAQEASEIFEELNSNDNTKYIFGITARCLVCSWAGTGSVKISKDDGFIFPKGTLITLCMKHHEETRPSGQNAVSQHNIFDLYLDDQKAGYLAESSAAVNGEFSLESLNNKTTLPKE